MRIEVCYANYPKQLTLQSTIMLGHICTCTRSCYRYIYNCSYLLLMSCTLVQTCLYIPIHDRYPSHAIMFMHIDLHILILICCSSHVHANMIAIYARIYAYYPNHVHAYMFSYMFMIPFVQCFMCCLFMRLAHIYIYMTYSYLLYFVYVWWRTCILYHTYILFMLVFCFCLISWHCWLYDICLFFNEIILWVIACYFIFMLLVTQHDQYNTLIVVSRVYHLLSCYLSIFLDSCLLDIYCTLRLDFSCYCDMKSNMIIYFIIDLWLLY